MTQDLSTSPGSRRAPEQRDRVREHTSWKVNRRIDERAAERLAALEGAGTPRLLRRLAELDREWNVDRALMANFAVLGGATFAAGVTRMRRQRGALNPWLGLFAAQLGFLLLHATVGWCPPVPVFRRLGLRTAKEIARERERVVGRLAAGARAAASAEPTGE